MDQSFEILSTNGNCITVLINGNTVTNICREIPTWKAAPRQFGLIGNENGTVWIDFVGEFGDGWEPWLRLTNWSKILICDETGYPSMFYRIRR